MRVSMLIHSASPLVDLVDWCPYTIAVLRELANVYHRYSQQDSPQETQLFAARYHSE